MTNNTPQWHLILDFETLGNDATNCAVIDSSILQFDWNRFTSDNPYTTKSLSEVKYFKASVSDQVSNYGFKIDNSTLDFWSQQDKEVRARIKPMDTDDTLERFVLKMKSTMMDKTKYHRWWSRSNTFDPIILDRIFNSTGEGEYLKKTLKHWLVRDTRSYIEGAFAGGELDNSFCPILDNDYFNEWFKKHDSRYDILTDVLRLQAVVRGMNDMEMLDR